MVELSVRTVRYALRAPLRASWGELRARETLRVRLDFADGLYGEGEAAPLEPFDGVSLASVSAAIDAYKTVLGTIEPTADVLAACRAERDLPQALAAIDMALWDHASRRTGTPLAWLLGGEHLTAWLLLPWVALPIAAPIVRVVRNRVDGPSLNGALARTGMLQLVFCLLLSAGLLLSR